MNIEEAFKKVCRMHMLMEIEKNVAAWIAFKSKETMIGDTITYEPRKSKE